LDLSYAAVDSSSVRAVGAGRKTGTNPTDRARPGSRRNILVDANGVPVSVILTGANRNDVTQLLPLVDAIPPIRGTRGRPLRKPKVIYADRGYDSESHRERLRDRGIKPVIAKRRTVHGSGLVNSAGSSNGRIRGSITSAVFAFASIVALTFTKHS
jgi:IS5 family transposase